jgi:hypothetical protein
VAGGRGVAATYTTLAGDEEPMGGRETGFTGGRHDGQRSSGNSWERGRRRIRPERGTLACRLGSGDKRGRGRGYARVGPLDNRQPTLEIGQTTSETTGWEGKII